MFANADSKKWSTLKGRKILDVPLLTCLPLLRSPLFKILSNTKKYSNFLFFFIDKTTFSIADSRFSSAVLQVHRRGKYFWLQMNQPPHPVFHFGMTGNFKVSSFSHIHPFLSPLFLSPLPSLSSQQFDQDMSEVLKHDDEKKRNLKENEDEPDPKDEVVGLHARTTAPLQFCPFYCSSARLF